MSTRENAYERLMATLRQALADGEEWQAAVLADSVLDEGNWHAARDSEPYTRASNALDAIADVKRAVRVVG